MFRPQIRNLALSHPTRVGHHHLGSKDYEGFEGFEGFERVMRGSRSYEGLQGIQLDVQKLSSSEIWSDIMTLFLKYIIK